MIIINFLKQKEKGLVLTELLFAVFVVSLVFGIIYSAYSLNLRASRESVRITELAQNGRVIIERISREIRQAKVIVTDLSTEESQATDTIIFEDGHVSSSYNYIRYFKEDNFIKREVVGYYFSGDPYEELVPWNSVPPPGQSLIRITIDPEEIIGEYILSFKFWGNKPIYLSLELKKENEILKMKNAVFSRNL
jgi:hypothetical protein